MAAVSDRILVFLTHHHAFDLALYWTKVLVHDDQYSDDYLKIKAAAARSEGPDFPH